jgi:hypothetical protein
MRAVENISKSFEEEEGRTLRAFDARHGQVMALAISPADSRSSAYAQTGSADSGVKAKSSAFGNR